MFKFYNNMKQSGLLLDSEGTFVLKTLSLRIATISRLLFFTFMRKKRKLSIKSSRTVDEHVGGHRCLAVLHFQVAVGTLVLPRLVDSGVGDAQRRAEEAWAAAVGGGEAGARRRSRPSQVLPTSDAGRKERHVNATFVCVRLCPADVHERIPARDV